MVSCFHSLNIIHPGNHSWHQGFPKKHWCEWKNASLEIYASPSPCKVKQFCNFCLQTINLNISYRDRVSKTACALGLKHHTKLYNCTHIYNHHKPDCVPHHTPQPSSSASDWWGERHIHWWHNDSDVFSNYVMVRYKTTVLFVSEHISDEHKMWTCGVCGRDARSAIFCDPDPVLFFKTQSKSNYSPSIFSNTKSKSKWSPKYLKNADFSQQNAAFLFH